MTGTDFAALRGAPLHRFGPDDWAEWYPRIRQGEGDMWRDVAVFFPAAGREPFDDAGAWDVLDAALPAELRGAVVRHFSAMDDGEPGPVSTGRGEALAFASGALLSLDGDAEARRWRRLEIIGRGLQGVWDPFGLGRGGVPG